MHGATPLLAPVKGPGQASPAVGAASAAAHPRSKPGEVNPLGLGEEKGGLSITGGWHGAGSRAGATAVLFAGVLRRFPRLFI